MLVLGGKEAEEGTVSVRHRKAGDLGGMTVEAFRDKALTEAALKTKD